MARTLMFANSPCITHTTRRPGAGAAAAAATTTKRTNCKLIWLLAFLFASSAVV